MLKINRRGIAMLLSMVLVVGGLQLPTTTVKAETGNMTAMLSETGDTSRAVETEEEFNEALADSSIHTIQLTKKITLSRSTDSKDNAFVINRPVTITGNGSGGLHLERSGIVLNADVTFENMTFAFNSPVRNAIIANGHHLILNNIANEGTYNIDLFCGGITDYNGGNESDILQAGTSGSITIKGINTFSGSTANGIPGGTIYAGSLSDVGYKDKDDNLLADIPNTYAGSATITIEADATGVSNIYAHGAREDRSGGHANEWDADANLYNVSGEVQIYLNNNSTITIDGNTGGEKNASFIYKDKGTGYLYAPILENVGSIYLLPADNGGITWLEPSTTQTKFDTLSVPENTRLSFFSMADKIEAASFEGGGELVFTEETDQKLTLSSAIGITKVAVGGVDFKGTGSTGTIGSDWNCITVADTEDDAEFVLMPNANNPNVYLEKDAEGNWVTVLEEATVLVTEIFVDSKFEIEEDLEFVYIPITVSYETEDENNFLANIPIIITVNGEETFLNNAEWGYEYIFEAADSDIIMWFEPGDEYPENLYIMCDGNFIPAGTYEFTLTVPGKYMKDGQAEILSFILQVGEELTTIDSVDISIESPVVGETLVAFASSATEGLEETTAGITWTKGGVVVEAGEKVAYGTTYTASMTFASKEDATFLSDVVATVNGESASIVRNEDGTVTVTYEFTTQVPTQYEIIVSESLYGEVRSSKESTYAGDWIILDIVPKLGCVLDTLQVMDSEGNEIEVDSDYRFSMPEGAVTVSATFRKENGDFQVTGNADGWYFENDVITFCQSGTYNISMAEGKKETSQIIEVTANDVILQLNSLNINAPSGKDDLGGEYGESELQGKSALTLQEDTHLILEGENVLNGGNGGNGISGNVTISGEGSLIVVAGEVSEYGYYDHNEVAGISGDVIIESGNVTVIGGNGHLDTGESCNGGDGISGDVKICGGTLIAKGGAAGIDGSSLGNPGKAIGGELSSGDGISLKITAGENEETAEVVVSYEGQTYALIEALESCEHIDQLGDGYCDICTCIINEKAALYGRTLILGGDIGVVFYYELTEAVQNIDTKVEFTLANGKTATAVFGDADNRTLKVGDKTYYGFMCKVRSTEMNQLITARLYCGEEALITQDYSVEQYCKNQLGKLEDNDNNAEVIALIKALVIYGGMSQTYFRVETDDLVSKDFEDQIPDKLTTDERSKLEEYQLSVISQENEAGIAYYGMSLLLYSETSMRAYFNLADGYSMDDFTFAVTNTSIDVNVEADCISGKNGNGNYLEITGIGATNLDSTYQITVSKDGKEILQVKYSPFVYIKNKLAYVDANMESATDEAKTELMNLQNVVTAMYRYNKAAEAYAELNK